MWQKKKNIKSHVPGGSIKRCFFSFFLLILFSILHRWCKLEQKWISTSGPIKKKKKSLYRPAVLTFRGSHHPQCGAKTKMSSFFLLLTQTFLNLQFTHHCLSGKTCEYVRIAWAHRFRNGEVKINWCSRWWIRYFLLCGSMPVPVFKWKYNKRQGDDKPNRQIN